jgi:hypothetical protein
MRSFKTYYSFLLGALGGLIGWFLIGVFFNQANEIVRGAVLGGCIGLFCTSYEALITGVIARIAKFLSIGALLGIAAGAVGLPVVELLYGHISGGADAPSFKMFFAGALGYALLGTLIGIAEGIGKGSQIWKAMLGGLLGGLLGGIFFELFGRSKSITDSQWYLAIALTLLGGSIAAGVSLVTTALKDAWFEVVSGKLAGSTINVSKYVAEQSGARNIGVIGNSSWEANVFLPGDSAVKSRHAELALIDGVPTITIDQTAQKLGAKLEANGRPVKSWRLNDGDSILIGETELVFRNKRK